LTIQPRPYSDLTDIEKMRHILIEGRQVSSHSGYIHVGDLTWWLYGILRAYPLNEIATLWEDEQGTPWAWSLFSPMFAAFDLFVHPDLRGSQIEAEMFDWTADRMRQFAPEGKAIETLWIFADDLARIGLVEGSGFIESGYYLNYMVHTLDHPLPEPTLPDGFTVQHMLDDSEAEARSAIHRAAFGSNRLTAEIYRDMMHAPGYDPTLDIVTVTPDGSFASFALGWFDPINRVGEFEPVGTHPDFQRRGLAKAVILAGMRQMQSRGAESVIVYAESDNVTAIRLYESLGFSTLNQIVGYIEDPSSGQQQPD
jgi:mycothiol synthase